MIQRRTAVRTASRTSVRTAEEPFLQPLVSTGTTFYIFVGILLSIVSLFGYAWYIQLTTGLGATAMRTPVGAAWGVYIANFVFFASMAHGGMAISAAVRLLKLTRFIPVARMGEVVTLVCVMMAGLSIMIDLGRPDRSFNMILYWPERVVSSPLTWDMTVIVLYFTLSSSYLWLTMRKDLYRLAGRFPRRGLIYKALLIGYSPDQEHAIERAAWFLSVAILVLIVMLSGGVIPWIFGLQSGRPGWFGAVASPYFLTAAMVTSIAAVIIIAAALSKIYRWQAHIKPEIYRQLGAVLGVFTHFYIYLTIAEQITMRYASPHGETTISEILLEGQFAPIFWPMLVIGLALPAVVLIAQTFRPKWFSLTRTVIASAVILVAFWIKRFIIVIPSLLRPLLPFPSGSYSPSWVEWSIIIGIFALAILLYVGFLKLFPIVEVENK
ncbi:MAG: polysulfide reductase NrfD [Chloroflexi bacterium]|nr:polysulfide reductase NrfD [Chloroflexota bacterium]